MERTGQVNKANYREINKYFRIMGLKMLLKLTSYLELSRTFI